MKSESALGRRPIPDLVNIYPPHSTYHFYWLKPMSAAFIAYLVKMLDSLANFTLYAKLPAAMDEAELKISFSQKLSPKDT